MKKQISRSIKAHLLPNLFILLSLLTIGVIPFGVIQAQRNDTAKSAAKSKVAPSGAAATKLSGILTARPATTGPAFSIGRPPAPAAPQVVLYDQYNNAGANATLSATFTDFPTFSADLADDFCVPANCTWTVNSIDADGVYFNGPGPATSWNVFIYNNASCLPGAQVYSILNTTVTQVGTTFTVNLTPAAVLPGGASGTQYWVEIQANMTFGTQGEWGWTDRTVQNLCPAAWQNPGGGFALCPTWGGRGDPAGCNIDPGVPDQVYRLNGTATGACQGGCATPTPTPCSTYVTTTSSSAIMPGTTDIGNHCDDCATAITLPFPVDLYQQLFTSVNASSNGSLDFIGAQSPFTQGCQVLPSTFWTRAILPFQDDLSTDPAISPDCSNFASGCGIFTATTGTAPTRVFIIEWRTGFFGRSGTANFEVKLYENNNSFFDVIYGATVDNGTSETSGVQASSTGQATTFSCGTGTLTNGLKVTYNKATCTPTPTPPCNPWTAASPYPVTDVRYGFAQVANLNGTSYFYVFGGVSGGTRINNVNRYNLTTGMWEARAPMPFTSEAPTCALMPATNPACSNIVYCAEGDTGTGFASYNIDTDTWTPLANTPSTAGNDYGSASGAFNGKFFLVGGTTNFLADVWVYNVGTNMWSPGTPAPDGFLLAGYQQVGQYLYLAGGWTGGVATGLTTTRRLDMTSAPGVWSNGPVFTMGRSDFGLAYDAFKNKLYALGGDTQGGGFFDSTNEVDELDISGWPAGAWAASPPNLPTPNRQANQAGFYGNGNIWSTGGINGQTFQFLADHLYRANMCGPFAYSAVSRINHGACGTFDIPLALSCSGTSHATVEPRSKAGSVGNYTIVVNFAGGVENINTAGTTVTCHNPAGGGGTVVTGSITGNGTNTITIPLTGVTDRQTLTLHIAGATAADQTLDIPISFLIGDVNGTGVVNATDIALIKSQSGQVVTACNFKEDVNANCAINSSDINLAKQNTGFAAPFCCP
jgi:hypothetical protein